MVPYTQGMYIDKPVAPFQVTKGEVSVCPTGQACHINFFIRHMIPSYETHDSFIGDVTLSYVT